MAVNKDRIWQRIQKVGEIAADGKRGIARFRFIEQDSQDTNLVIEWMKKADLCIRKDAAGNVIGRREGKKREPVVMAGSHLDTVINGGKFDGVTGVISALECVEILKERNIHTGLPIEVITFANEEGSRFPGGLMGSLAVAGKLPPTYPYEIRDGEGILLAEEMKRWGAKPDLISEASRKGEIRAFFELHIEQGRVLEEAHRPIGIVNGIAGLHQGKFSISGECGHAGAIAMRDRKDPMVAAGIIIKKIEEIASQSKTGARGTVGYIKAFPGGDNVIPGKVEFTTDFRYIDKQEQSMAEADLQDYVAKICQNRNLTHQFITNQQAAPVFLDSNVISLMETAVKDCLIPYLLLPSWAAHDAIIMSNICLTGMIFVRSYKGLSHCPQEFSFPEDIADGAELLYSVLYKTANEY